MDRWNSFLEREYLFLLIELHSDDAPLLSPTTILSVVARSCLTICWQRLVAVFFQRLLTKFFVCVVGLLIVDGTSSAALGLISCNVQNWFNGWNWKERT